MVEAGDAGSKVASVAELWRHPAKSMIGESLPSVTLTPTGMLGDRSWAVRDEVRGGIQGARKLGGLMKLSARYVDEPTPERPVPALAITLPDGSTVGSDDPEVHARLSAAIDHEVTLWPLQPAESLDHYRRTPPDSEDFDVEVRTIFGRTPDEPLPDLSVFPVEIYEYETPPGTYVDAYPLLIVSTQSLDTLQQLAPDSRPDVRRFRPNLVVDMVDDGSPFPEMDWIGRQLAVGDAVVEVVAPCPRCVMITREFADLPQDRDLLRTVVKQAEQNVGVYATVRDPGAICTGDTVRLVASEGDDDA